MFSKHLLTNTHNSSSSSSNNKGTSTTISTMSIINSSTASCYSTHLTRQAVYMSRHLPCTAAPMASIHRLVNLISNTTPPRF
jgi:hypothetical protein